jgi:hypothetical protein
VVVVVVEAAAAQLATPRMAAKTEVNFILIFVW